MKRLLKNITGLICSILFFASCQKEFTPEGNIINPPGSNGGTAAYSFSGGTGTCANDTIKGTYNKGTLLDSTNFVIIKVQVDSIGSYNISTAIINGISFKGAGNFTAKGPQSVLLMGSGTALEAGVFTYTPGVAGCTFQITFTNTGASSGTAVFTLNGAPDSCTTPIINGKYLQGVALDTSNNVIVKATVTTAGTYTITSNAVNGISFSGTGNFAATGQQTVKLTASGTASAAGAFTFTPGTNGCQFTITFLPATISDCKECIYVPMCVGSKYEYADTTISPDSGSTIIPLERMGNITSSVDTTINSRIYKKIGVFDGTTTAYNYISCLNGETNVIAYSVQSTISANVITISFTELKANAPVGATWTDTTLVNGVDFLYRNNTIIEKGISRVVSGVTFNDVIHLKVDETAFYAGPPAVTTPGGTTDYYFAKGVGFIEAISTILNPVNNQTYVFYHSVLKTYSIP